MLAIPCLLLVLPLLGPRSPDGWVGVYLAAELDRVVLAEVLPGSPAAKAGLRPGDAVLAIGEHRVHSVADFGAAVRLLRGGAAIDFLVQRGDTTERIAVRVAPRPVPQLGAATPPAAPQLLAVAAPGDAIGPPAPAMPVEPALAAAQPVAETAGTAFLGVALTASPDGLQVQQVLPGSPAASAAVPAGAIVLTVGGERVADLVHFDARLAAARPGELLSLGLREPGGDLREVLVRLGDRSLHGPLPLPDSLVTADRAALAAEIESVRSQLAALQQRLATLLQATRRE